jgi:multidrug resistance efflux pump
MEKENKNENEVKNVAKKNSFFSKLWVKSLAGIILIFIVFGLFLYWRLVTNKVEIDNSSIESPIINLASSTPGILDDVYVNEGDVITANTPVAKVGSEIVTSKVDGIVVAVYKQQGQFFGAGTTVVSMINPKEEKVVGKVDEDKGLADIKVGQPATFTVDAFGSRQFNGVVSEVSPMSNESDVVFDISDKREIKNFDIKVSFDTNEYSMLKQGMSAKIKVYTN